MNALDNTFCLPGDTQTRMLVMTIADTQRILATWTDLAPGRVRKLRTALSTAARALAPDEHPSAAASIVRFDCVSLRRLLQAPPATFGMSPERGTSLCSELRYILRRHDPHDRGQRLPDAVQSVLEALPNFRQLALVDFLRFLEARNIDFDAVDADTLGAYEARCTTRTLCPDPAARVRQAAATWNWACKHVPGWPGKRLTRADRANGYTLPLTAYPESFQTGCRAVLRSAAVPGHRPDLLR